VALLLIAILVFLVIALLVVFAGGPWYIVGESEQVVITRFGATVGRPVTTPGLKMKIPFIDRANFVDTRVLDWDGAPNEIPTSDKRFIFVDTFAQWRIVDPLFFVQRLRDERGAQSRLDDILDGETRNIIATHDLIEVVRTSNREFVWPTPTGDDVPRITAGRAVIEQEILDAASARAEVLGIEIIDFRLKRTTYVDVDRRAVHKRMIAERLRMAEEFRAEGEAEAARIRRAAGRN
jgi:membrane protease subunit HflC